MTGGPLGVLCQQILGMAGQRSVDREALALVKRAYPYRDLSSDDFTGCLDYLSGRRRDGQEWLPPRLAWDSDRWSLLDERTARIVRQNIGTILSDDASKVRLREGEKLGEVEESFADRLRPGDRFLLGGKVLEYRKFERGAVLVDEAVGLPATPRWSGAGWFTTPELARRIYALRVQAAEALREGAAALRTLLAQDYQLGDAAVAMLVEYFQKQECVSEIPDANTLLIEIVSDEWALTYYCHTPLNQGATMLSPASPSFAWLAFGPGGPVAGRRFGFSVQLREERGRSSPPKPQAVRAEGFLDDLDQSLHESPILQNDFAAWRPPA